MKSYAKAGFVLLFGVAVGALGMQTLSAQSQIQRHELRHEDLSGTPNTEVYMAVIDAPPGSAFAPHIHHGDEFSYVMDGAIELDIAGQGAKTVKAGDSIHVPRETVHSGKVVSATPAKILAVHIVDKGKPLAEPAPAK